MKLYCWDKKKGRNAKTGRKHTFNLEIHTKKNQEWKKESTFIWIFSLLYPLCIFFCILNLKIHIKKDKNAKKSYFFQICKIHMQRRQKIIFQKRYKKAEMQKKMQKSRGRCSYY